MFLRMEEMKNMLALPSSVECCPRGIGEAGDGVKLVRGSKLEGWILAEVGFRWPI